MDMTKQLSWFALILLFSSCMFSCGGTEEGSGNSGDPSDLTLEIVQASDDSGMVTVQATASNAILYEFDMGTNDSNDQGSSTDGSFEYVYESSGNFIIEVKAYGNSGKFIRAQKQIAVMSGEPDTAGEGYTTPISYDGWNLVCNDEFDGNILNQSMWSFQNGNGCPDICGWGNNELEWYRPENSWVNNGLLTIEARKEMFQSNEYTSTKLISQGKKAFQYGRVDVRAKLPKGKGLWPAIWMLGSNISSVSWPACGEIDIMEMVGGSGGEKTSYGTLHWQNGEGEHASSGDSRSVTQGLDQLFHVYSIIWNENGIKWLLNDVEYHSINTTGPDFTAFHKPFYMILNVAIGGNWPGNPTDATEFPTQMQIDYVRVFQEQ